MNNIKNFINKSKINTYTMLAKNQYEKITTEFKSYGSFINYCIINKINTNPQQRQKILKELYRKDVLYNKPVKYK